VPIVYKEKFDGKVWKIVYSEASEIGLEIRNEETLEVSFLKINLSNFGKEHITHEHLTWWTSFLYLNKSGAFFKHFESERDPFRQQSFFLNINGGTTTVATDFQIIRHTNFVSPISYEKDSDFWVTTSAFIKKEGFSPIGAIDYVETDDFFVLAYHVEKEGALNRRLCIYSIDGEALYQEETDKKLQGQATQAFLTFSNLIIFVRDKNELVFFEV